MEATEQREATYHLLVRLPITQKQLKGTGSQLMVGLNHFSPPINPLEFNPFDGGWEFDWIETIAVKFSFGKANRHFC